MLEAERVDDDVVAGEWEPWLAERFVAYLLHDATGQRRPVADVERALERLSGQTGALARLALLAFLLDPELGLGAWLRDDVPAFLRRIRVRSEAVCELRRNAARGRVDWARTFAIRSTTRDPTWIASRSQRRTFDTPELVVVRHVLEVVRRTATTVLRTEGPGRTGWAKGLAETAALAAAATAHSALHEVPSRLPSASERGIARNSHDPTVRHAARVIDMHEAMQPEPDGQLLRDALARFALVPVNDDVRFQLFAMLAIIECIDSVVAPARRADSVVASSRNEVARWDGDSFTLLLHYDQAAEPGVHAALMRHYFGSSHPLRPDIRLVLVLNNSGRRRELLADAKRSTSRSYLADAHHKMRGYVADRPHVFAGCTPKALVLCPAASVAAPRAGDDVVFIGSPGHVDGTLRDAISTWWLSCRSDSS